MNNGLFKQSSILQPASKILEPLLTQGRNLGRSILNPQVVAPMPAPHVASIPGQVESYINFALKKLYGLIPSATKTSSITPTLFNKVAQARWRRPENLPGVQKKLEEQITKTKRYPNVAETSKQLIRDSDLEHRKRLMSDELTHGDALSRLRLRGRTQPLAQPPLMIPDNVSKTQADVLRKAHFNNPIPLPTTSQLNQARISMNLRNSDPLAAKEYSFRNFPMLNYRQNMLGSHPVNFDQRMNTESKLKRQKDILKQRQQQAEEKQRLTAETNKRFREYIQTLFPYVAGGAGIGAGAGVLAANR